MKIYLVRHGESQSNYDNAHGHPYFCGQLDVLLTDRGMKSAHELTSYFKILDVQHVYVSDQLRTKQTYNGIFPYNIPTTYSRKLRERSLGVFEGKSKQEISHDIRYEKNFKNPSYKYFRHSFT